MTQQNTAPKFDPVRALSALEILILLSVGQHHRRPAAVTITEIKRVMLPAPIDESLDALGHMGLLRCAEDAHQRPLRGTVRVSGTGWLQVCTQKNRAVRKVLNEAAALEASAEKAANPSDPNRRKDPSGAKNFEAQAKRLMEIGEAVERMYDQVIPTAPIPQSVRDMAQETGEDDPTADLTQQTNTEHEIDDALDAADPSNAQRIVVEGAPSGGEGLGDMASDVPKDEMIEQAPARRRRNG